MAQGAVMHGAHIRQLAGALIILAHMLLVNSCNGSDTPTSCLHFLSTRQIDAFTQLPESHELLKALGLVTGVALAILSVKQLQKIIVEIDKQDRLREQQTVQLPATLYERINHRIGIDRKIKNEILERERLLTLRYPQESTKKLIPLGEQICWEEMLYDKTIETGCLILDLPRHR